MFLSLAAITEVAIAQNRPTVGTEKERIKPRAANLEANYQPIHLIANIGKTDENNYTNFGVELNASRRLIEYVNYGAGLAYYRFEWSNNGGFDAPYPYISNEANTFEPSLFLSAYLPLNKILGNTDHSSTGFFPYVSGGLFFNSSSTTIYTRASSSSGTEETSASDTKFGFYNIFGIDYKFGKSFGLSVATQKFNSFWFGVNFQL